VENAWAEPQTRVSSRTMQGRQVLRNSNQPVLLAVSKREGNQRCRARMGINFIPVHPDKRKGSSVSAASFFFGGGVLDCIRHKLSLRCCFRRRPKNPKTQFPTLQRPAILPPHTPDDLLGLNSLFSRILVILVYTPPVLSCLFTHYRTHGSPGQAWPAAQLLRLQHG